MASQYEDQQQRAQSSSVGDDDFQPTATSDYRNILVEEDGANVPLAQYNAGRR